MAKNMTQTASTKMDLEAKLWDNKFGKWKVNHEPVGRKDSGA